ncbi:glycosyltransferase [Candidatus Woesearchaeota archaeon]|nr:glycosyltransferase [Candidatus Woesearchaeota archaeon]
MDIVKSLFIADVAIILLSFVFYKPLLIFFINLLGKKKPAKSSHKPELTVIVPTYNEERNIKKKLRNLIDINYPKKKLKIIVSDDCSTDKTAEIANKFKKIILLNAKGRNGKIAAINNALIHAKTEIVVLTDADAILEKDSIRNLVGYFSGDEIGGVTANIKIDVKNSWYSYGQKKFQDDENNLRNYEGILDSVSSMDGRLCAFRRSLIKQIDEKSAADDLELAYQIRKKGFKAVFAQDADAHEKAPADAVAEFSQKRRRSLYTINVIFRHIGMLFNPKYGCFGILIFPFRRLAGILSPFMLLFAFFYLLAFQYLISIIFLIALILLLHKRARGLIIYYSIVVFSILLSWIDFVLNGFKAKGEWNRPY